MGPQDHMFN